MFRILEKVQCIQSSRIIELGQDMIQEVNEILHEIDILITDYSSVFIDYLLLNRPCIFIPYDKEKYEKDVGFLFDDYDYWTPGRKVATYSEFITAINGILSGDDQFKERREEMRKIFHYYQKKNASEKVVQYIENVCNKKR